ncbi:peroxisomal membrane protein 11B-like [Anneissia japonica]|uniref:peroxisomal membrane protein 11B-like n=1 Tax=Anneissia japonica TaxID=1529436 RepID=UPI001425967C|nr:peroxisomal membrane protein 11B-like [Anneissia japonica]
MDVATHVVKFGGQTNGRDKLFRTVQYSSKLVWWGLENSIGTQETITKLKNLEKALSTTRKLLRFGKSFDMLHAALRTIHHPDVFVRVTVTMSKINQAFYLLFDHLLWADRVGVFKTDKDKYSKISAKFWLATIILNLSRDFYELAVLLGKTALEYERGKKSEDSLRENGKVSSSMGDVAEYQNDVFIIFRKCLRENVQVTLDLVKNLADLFLPTSTLGYLKLSPGVQGLFGIIGSLVGVLTVWDASYKLSP